MSRFILFGMVIAIIIAAIVAWLYSRWSKPVIKKALKSEIDIEADYDDAVAEAEEYKAQRYKRKTDSKSQKRKSK